jgi:hypothetical protein
MWEHIKRYRTVAFHALYGLPCALVALLDGLRGVDFSPFFSQPTAAMIASGVAIGAVTLHFFADTHFGSIRDDGTGGINIAVSPPIENPLPPDTVVNTAPAAKLSSPTPADAGHVMGGPSHA